MYFLEFGPVLRPLAIHLIVTNCPVLTRSPPFGAKSTMEGCSRFAVENVSKKSSLTVCVLDPARPCAAAANAPDGAETVKGNNGGLRSAAGLQFRRGADGRNERFSCCGLKMRSLSLAYAWARAAKAEHKLRLIPICAEHHALAHSASHQL